MGDSEHDYTCDSEEEEECEQECEIADDTGENCQPFCFGFGHRMRGRGRGHGPSPMWGPFGEGSDQHSHHPRWGGHARGHPAYPHPRHQHDHRHRHPAHHHQHGPRGQHPHGPPGHHAHESPRNHHPHGPPPMFGAFKRGGRGRGRFTPPWCKWGTNEDRCCNTTSRFPGCECGAAGGKPADIYVYVNDFAPEELKVKISDDKLTVTATHAREEQQKAGEITQPRRESMTHVYQLPTGKKVDRRGIKAKLVCRGRFLRVKMPYKKVQVPIEREDEEPIPEMEDLVISKD